MNYLNFGWLLDGVLAGAAGPTNGRDLMFLKLQDIRAIIRMEERTISGEGVGLVDLFEPVPDFSAPEMHQIKRMVRFIEEQIETWDRPVVVTCMAGIGRTGTVLACYMVHVGYTPRNAIKLVRDLRPKSLENWLQERAVHEFADLLKTQ
ncbi:MAG: dual specificity protein phosphatase family protein [Dehalococcoidia bacterium]|nr:dual specificity protein phosphatase family protein [Dehalococcoidia bacterium]MDP6226656.1 dual specificity protein phosphatase family protein [Dehalococcoidia bacterium]MDP7084096.1 dual specificity protein phosphatase family protein [Dehalococcoidia bacterium]MDP7200833.1 dual specificity protein phosphatase family protein [Dehalococcoidia bacterium]MDP7509770.1 dual specificity protein phosphatase family protein [Dehalococcoidia bacterium]